MKPTHNPFRRLALATFALSLAALTTPSLPAANRSWLGISSGDWSNPANWSGSVGSNDTAIFAAIGNDIMSGHSIINFEGTGSVKTILFDTANAAAYTIGSGGAGTQTLILSDNGDVTLNSSVANHQLFNANLTLGTATGASYLINNGSAGRNLTFAGAIQGGAGGSAGAKTLTVSGAGNTMLTGNVVNGGSSGLSIVHNSTAKLTLSGVNSYTGGTTLTSGILALGNSGALGTTGAISFGGGTLQYSTSNATDYSARFSTANSQAYKVDTNGRDVTWATNLTSSGGNLTKSGLGTLTLSGTNTYSGGTTLSGGALALGSSGSLGTTGTISFTGGTLKHSASNATDYSARFSTAASQAYSVDTNGRNISWASNLSSSGGSLNKSGLGTLTLTNSNSYTGKTTISGGSLALGASGSIANSSEVSLNGGAFNVSTRTNFALGTNQSLTGSGSVTGDLIVNGTLAIGASPGTVIFNDDLTLGQASISNFEFTVGAFTVGSYDLAQGGNLSQSVSFGGPLNLLFDAQQSYVNESSVKIFDFESYSGNFSTLNFSGLGEDQAATFDASSGTVTVIPESKALLLSSLGLLALLRRRK